MKSLRVGWGVGGSGEVILCASARGKLSAQTWAALIRIRLTRSMELIGGQGRDRDTSDRSRLPPTTGCSRQQRETVPLYLSVSARTIALSGH